MTGSGETPSPDEPRHRGEAASRGETRPGGMWGADVSVVIPCLNEAENVAAAIGSAFDAGAIEVIVCDGGSDDGTESRARASGATAIVRSIPGRGIQMNAGATFAHGEFVLFLHADSRLTAGCLEQVVTADGAEWGGFRQRIDSPRGVFRLIERGNAARVRWRRLPFGDQAIFVRRSLFKRVGGFPEVPLMEDVELARRLRPAGPPRLLEGPVVTSPRRWEQTGVVRQTLRNWKIQIAYAAGVPPDTLRDWYR